eukprot:4743547-Prymnesium_polylepis.1
MYSRPIMLTHIDDEAVAALTKHYARTLPGTSSGSDLAHLDLCSSWVSFLPDEYKPARCVGLGMNAHELRANKQLTETAVFDLNKGDRLELPFADGSDAPHAEAGRDCDHVVQQPDVLAQSRAYLDRGERMAARPRVQLLLSAQRIRRAGGL